ncbi:hypothetical protein D3C80_1715760 [compost metagenome]
MEVEELERTLIRAAVISVVNIVCCFFCVGQLKHSTNKMQLTKQQEACLVLLILTCFDEEKIEYGQSMQRRALYSNHGLGVIKEKRRQMYNGTDVYRKWTMGSDPMLDD